MFRPAEASNVEIDARPFSFGRLIVVIGPLDTRSARSFLDVFERAIEQAAIAVVIDLGRAPRIDSLGRAALLRASRRAAQLGKSVLIVGQTPADDLGKLDCRVLPSRRVAIAAAIASSIRA